LEERVTKSVQWLPSSLVVFTLACGSPAPRESAKTPEPESAYRVYVTNEASGDLSVIDAGKHEVIATVKLGKRPRGIHASADGKTIYVALSGSPFAPPGVDESKLPPPDHRRRRYWSV
jgi:YVTN family beta-propeller protein